MAAAVARATVARLDCGKRRRRRLGVHAVRARQKAAGDLDAGTGSLAVVDEPARALVLDLVELVAVDGKRPAIGLQPGAPDAQAEAARLQAPPQS